MHNPEEARRASREMFDRNAGTVAVHLRWKSGRADLPG
jgi:hypothetical protein